MSKGALAALVAIGVAAIAWLTSALLVAQVQTITLEGFTKLATLLVAPLASLLAAGAAIWAADRQSKTTRDVEFLRLDLGRRLEGIKNRLSAERKAYDELYAAMSTYYYTLSLLEVGKLDAKRLLVADQGMVAASRYLISILDEKDRGCWMRYWQACRELEEAAAAVSSIAEREALWGAKMNGLDQLFTEFESAASKRLADH